jgi:catechol 2,3-dioxygenase-like lactoylglutathione lyase family enzyme
MTVRRIVPNLEVADRTAAGRFYADLLGLSVVMDQGWITTVAEAAQPLNQLSLLTHDATGPVVAAVSIEVDDVDAAYQRALDQGVQIDYPLTDEPWGVRRFFLRDPDGHVINVLGHGQAAEQG